ncbi:MAG: TonB-dependent receptor, partial [Acidobacteriota bacterium]|nr:TonB-dependent receptor [Acidobacteriota bacterium]
FLRFLSAMVLVTVAAAPVHAQSSSITGVVTDSAGGVVPGATVSVLNNATQVATESVSNAAGQFSFPALPIGTYTVTVSLGGFKTFVAKEVRLLGGQPGNVNATLEVGDLTEKVEVKAGSELVQTQSTSVSSTLSVEQLSELPLVSRNALYAVALLPGVSTTGGPRGAVINGLPNNTVNITIDGVNTGNMLASGDGFFSMVTPRMDAVEEVTVTGAVPGSGGGAGSVQIAMTTRSGTNNFDGSVYHYWRQPAFNSNYYFNKVNDLPKNEVIAHQYGFRLGGPIVLPSLYDGRGKAFFFFNFEHQHQPSSVTRTRTFYRDSATSGIFGYNVTVGGEQARREVNLVNLAAANGQISTFDPTVMSLLATIKAATATTGTINDTGAGNTLQYVWQAEAVGDQYSPTTRLDFNLSDRHRLSGAYWLQRFKSNPDLLNNKDPIFPGLANVATQNSYRTTGNSSLRSTFGTNMVNELRGGFQWSPNAFYTNITADQFEDQGGYGLSFPASTVSGVTHTISPQPRNTTTWDVSNTLNWLKGRHSLSVGGSYAGVLNRNNSYTVVPNVVLGLDQNLDPAAGLFNSTNFPGATAGQLTEARGMYALLTGRVSSIAGTARLDAATGNYVYNGDLKRLSRQDSYALFAQDSWRATPTLTLNGGIRWDVHMPFSPGDDTWSRASIEDICGISGLGNGVGGRACNIFTPGATGGQLIPTYDRFNEGERAHDPNWTDFAPNVGVAWRPDVQDGWLKTLLGDPEQATFRAGYGMSFNQERIDRFTTNAGANPGGTIGATRNNGTGYPLVLPGETHPVLLRQTSRLGPPPFPETPVYPLAAITSDSVNIFPDKLKTPRVHSYSAGVQRSIGRDMALEVRYVGNRNLNTWAEENWNERSVFASGFFDEFKKAQANLAANIVAGKGNTFAFTGAPGTTPLPIHLGYLVGSADASNPAAYTSTNFTNAAFLNRFSALNPRVYDTSTTTPGALQGIENNNTFRANAAKAGLPINLLVMNPRALGGTFVVQDQDWTRFNSLQVDLRRRLAQGLLVSANYTYGIGKESSLETLAYDRITVDNTDVPHVFKMNWHYEVPVGRGRRFGAHMSAIADALIGNWEFSGNGRVQTQRYRMVGVKLEGMTVDDLQKNFKIRTSVDPVSGVTEVFSFPQDIIDNTWAAFSTDPTTPTGYSLARGVPTGRYIRPASDAGCIAIYRYDCNTPDINLNGPLFSRWDMRIKKRFPFGSRVNIEVMAEVLNVFDNINFNHNTDFDDGEDTFRVTTAYTDINTTFDPGGRIGQLVWRINW